MNALTARPIAAARQHASEPGRKLAILILAGILAAACVYIAREDPNPTVITTLGVAVIAAAGTYLMTSSRLEITLGILMVYLGVADGYIKLRTGSSVATLGRDVLLYAIVVGVIVRTVVRKERFDVPPISAWAVAFVFMVIVQITNPHSGGYSHSLPSLRPHLEFVPLFFFGYWTMRSKRRLRGFLLLLLIIATANGIVSVIQFNMTPAQLSSWGPGYAARINGTDGTSGRVLFSPTGGVSHLRPFALGSDIGFGGEVGMLAAPAALALLALARRRRVRVSVAILTTGVIAAVVTSQARASILGTIVAVLAFLALVTGTRRMFPTLMTLAVTLAIAGAVVATIASNSTSGAFAKYSSITPGHLLSTASQDRGGSLAAAPGLAREYPFGAGLGSGGPAAGYASSGGTPGLDAENEFDYLVIELGVPGLIVMAALNLKILLGVVPRMRRIEDSELRLLLAALAAGFFCLFVTWFGAITTANTPGSPFFWFVSGIFAYWLVGPGWQQARQRARGSTGTAMTGRPVPIVSL